MTVSTIINFTRDEQTDNYTTTLNLDLITINALRNVINEAEQDTETIYDAWCDYQENHTENRPMNIVLQQFFESIDNEICDIIEGHYYDESLSDQDDVEDILYDIVSDLIFSEVN